MTTLLRRLACLTGVLTLAVLGAVFVPSARGATLQVSAGPLQATTVGTNQVIAVPYFSWNRKARYATVVLPRDYGPGDAEALPCIVQPHGRGGVPTGPASRWDDLPTTERFMVICPDSSGRRDPANSWGVEGQLQDISEIVDVVEKSLPWVHVDHQRLYLVGISMGGQETLCTLARYPDRFAAGLCVDGNANLAARYREFPFVDMTDTRPLMRREVGGTPSQVPWLYQRRSSTPFAATLATSGVPSGSGGAAMTRSATTRPGRRRATSTRGSRASYPRRPSSRSSGGARTARCSAGTPRRPWTSCARTACGAPCRRRPRHGSTAAGCCRPAPGTTPSPRRPSPASCGACGSRLPPRRLEPEIPDRACAVQTPPWRCPPA